MINNGWLYKFFWNDINCKYVNWFIMKEGFVFNKDYKIGRREVKVFLGILLFFWERWLGNG